VDGAVAIITQQHSDGDLEIGSTTTVESEEPEPITSTHLYPMKLTSIAHQHRGKRSSVSPESVMLGAIVEEDDDCACNCKMLTLVNSGDVLTCVSVAIVALQVLTYAMIALSLLAEEVTCSPDLVQKWDSALMFGSLLALIYTAAHAMQGAREIRSSTKALKSSKDPVGSCASRKAWLQLFIYCQWLSLGASMIVFSMVIARATSLIDLIANFIGLGIVSEADNLVAGVLNIADPSPKDGSETVHTPPSSTRAAGRAFMMVPIVGSI
jgi:hypothetical protein